MTPEQKARKKEYARRYSKTPRGKFVIKRKQDKHRRTFAYKLKDRLYKRNKYHTPEGKAATKKYQSSAKGKRSIKRCKTSKKYKAWQRSYSASETCKESVRRYRASDKGKLAAWKIHLKRYGLTPQQYSDMLTAQINTCAICHKPSIGRRMHVDHDHATGKVRGLLCRACNSGIGFFQDNIALLLTAVEYLRKCKEC